MKKNDMELLKNQFYKVVIKEPGEKKVCVVHGTIENIDDEAGFLFINSEKGIGVVRLNTIVAIKPRQKPNKKKSLINDRTGLVGIGTLIVFIAMILVAAVAATVIIQTSNELENRAQSVGKQTISEVSSGVKIVDMTGYTDQEKTVIQYLAISIRPRAGSLGIDMNETLVYLEYNELTVLSLNFADFNNNGTLWNGSTNGSIAQNVGEYGVFHTLNLSTLDSTNYGIIAIRDSDNSITNNFGIASNDMVMIIINLTSAFDDTNGIPPGSEIQGRIVPEIGAEGLFFVSAPAAFHHRVLDL